MAIRKEALAAKIKNTMQNINDEPQTFRYVLKSISNTYRYSFENQMAIFSQRKDVTAVASMNLWNRLHRSVQKGHIGIRLLNREDFSRQIYVWDINDTEGEEIKLWQLQDAEETAISNALERIYGEKEESLEEKIGRIVKEEAEEIYMQRLEGFTRRKKDSLTEEYIAAIGDGFEVASKMAAYLCKLRCGLVTDCLPQDAFGFYDIPKPIREDEDYFYMLFSSASEAASGMLSFISQEVKKEIAEKRKIQYNKEKEEERGRNNENGKGNNGEEELDADGQIRPRKGSIFTERESETVQTDAGGRRDAGVSDGHGQERAADEGEYHEAEDEKRGRERRTESAEPTGMDSEDESNHARSGQHRHAGNDFDLISINNHICRKLDEWQQDTASYMLGQCLEDEAFFCVAARETIEDFQGKYTYEFDRMPERERVQDVHISHIADLAIDRNEAEAEGYVLPQRIEADFDIVEVQAASRSNYKGYHVFAQFSRDSRDNGYQILMGKQENYHVEEGKGLYDNRDNSLLFITENRRMFGLLTAGRGWVKSQQEMIDIGAFTEEDYREYAKLEAGLFRHFEKLHDKMFSIDIDNDASGEAFSYPNWRKERNIDLVDRAMRLIDEYCMEEFEHHADFSEPEEVGLACTETSDGKHEIQVSCDLLHFEIRTQIDGTVVDKRNYDTLQELIDQELAFLEFSALTQNLPEHVWKDKNLRYSVLEVYGRGVYGIWDNQEEAFISIDEKDITTFVTEAEALAALNPPKDITPEPVDIGEQMSFISTESVKHTADLITKDDIDQILMYGSNDNLGRAKICLEYMKRKSAEEITAALPVIYKGSYGLQTHEKEISARYEKEGIRLSIGGGVNEKDCILLSWAMAEDKIRSMIEKGTFASRTDVAIAHGYEKTFTAERLIAMRHDLSDEAKMQHYLPSVEAIENQKLGWEGSKEILAEKLYDESFLQVITEEYERFYQAYRENRDLLRFSFHKTDALRTHLKELSIPLTQLSMQAQSMAEPASFITNDEIIHDLKRGSGFAGGKYRIYRYFQEKHSLKEKVAFLSGEYGTGGHSYAFAGENHSRQNHDSKGLEYQKYDCETIKLSWSQVAHRIDELMQREDYLTDEELLEIAKEKELQEENPEDKAEAINAASQSNLAAEEQNTAENYHITNEELGDGSKAEKIRRNLDAIRTLKEIESRDGSATFSEQEILAGYVGWGGIPEIFEETHAQHQELKNLLTEEEYTSARESVLSAYYTKPVVIDAIYGMLKNFGFDGGNLLEPSCGVGNFFGRLPSAMRESTNLYGVELDSLTARLAQMIYPQAKIIHAGYEETKFEDNSFDVAIGNVPFGDFGVNDHAYSKENFLIHDYFFAKSLDKVRSGGLILFITSSGTMDKKSSKVREYIAKRANLLGAIRLPNSAFSSNAGTKVTSDILVLQKKEIPKEPEENLAWLHVGTDEKGLSYNQYFIEHPEMVIGSMQEVTGPYGNAAACILSEPERLKEKLAEAADKINGHYSPIVIFDEDEEETNSIPADITMPSFSYSMKEGKLFYKETSVMYPVDRGSTVNARIAGMIKIRETLRELIQAQMEDKNDEEIRALQEKLANIYQSFTKKHGAVSSRANALAFRDDSAYPLICSLEELDEEGNVKRLADIFHKRTISAKKEYTSVASAKDALAISLRGKGYVDISYMQSLYDKSENEMVSELSDQIFRKPDFEQDVAPQYLTRDEYLSGNVRRKLAEAKAADEGLGGIYQENVAALTEVLPKWLDGSQIDVRLGSTWVPPHIVEEFIAELLNVQGWGRQSLSVTYNSLSGTWNVEGGYRWSVEATRTYGTSKADAYRILRDTLNLRTVTITEEDSEGRRVTNLQETTLACQKQDIIKDKFKQWVWKDIERRKELEDLYNKQFNSVVARKYDGSFLDFPGMNASITLKPHQKDAVARQIFGGNTLLAHTVGAGKTFEMATAIMEKKRLGLCHKAMLVVPNHLTDQWANEFLRLYPNAKVLATTKKDFTPMNRKRFCSRIATGDYDAIIIGHSQFERIPLSKERQTAFINLQITDIEKEITVLKEVRGERISIKQLELMKKKLTTKLQALNDASIKDNTVTFEELGIDFLCVDEAHNYKNLALNTKMSNVAGISGASANKAYDMFAKCRYLDEITDGCGITFATGTPVSNSMAELYTMQRYLQYDTLKEMNLLSFDAWASTFGETVSAWELAPEGTKYKRRTRFAKFFNLPELMGSFCEVADIKTADMLNLDTPNVVQETVTVPATQVQLQTLREIGKRADAIREGSIDPSIDNMLKITTDGRKLALDERILLGGSEHPLGKTKVDYLVEAAAEIYHRTAEKKSTQLIFCDLSTPKKDGNFSIYDEVKKGLIAHGVAEEEIAFMHDYNSDSQKENVRRKVRTGAVRFLLGSTALMGEGMNVQNKLIAIHHLDVPWRPKDLDQRQGRIERQGNENEEVYVYRYITANTFDAYSWQTLETKQRYISQIMTSKSPARSMEDIDDTCLDYAATKALCTGNPKIKEKMELENDISQLKLLEQSYHSAQIHMQEELYRSYPESLASKLKELKLYEEDNALYQKNKGDKTVQAADAAFTNPAAAGTALFALTAKYKNEPGWKKIGSYKGFDISTMFEDSYYKLRVKNPEKSSGYIIKRGADPEKIVPNIDELFEGYSEKISKLKETIEGLETNMEKLKKELEVPFAYAKELSEKEKRLEKLDEELLQEQQANTAESAEEKLPESEEEVTYEKYEDEEWGI